jgi:hypothetical protein
MFSRVRDRDRVPTRALPVCVIARRASRVIVALKLLVRRLEGALCLSLQVETPVGIALMQCAGRVARSPLGILNRLDRLLRK